MSNTTFPSSFIVPFLHFPKHISYCLPFVYVYAFRLPSTKTNYTKLVELVGRIFAGQGVLQSVSEEGSWSPPGEATEEVLNNKLQENMMGFIAGMWR